MMDANTEAWILFAGRLHPLLVHAPIGLLLGLVALELWGRLLTRASVQPSQRRMLAFVLGASAAATAASGWQFGIENGYSSGDFLWHRGLGIAFAVACALVGVAGLFAWRGLYRLGLVLAVATVIPAGHFGATMTHGKDFLTEPFAEPALPAEPEPAPVESDTPEAEQMAQVDPLPVESGPTWYDERIAPVLEAYCTKCHGAEKQKGDLSLHTGEIVVAGSEFGPVVIPGDPAQSSLMQRILAPVDDDDHMPPASKPQPSATEVAELERWIAAGAPLDGPAPEPLTPEPPSLEESGSLPQPAAPVVEVIPPPAGAMDALRAQQVHVEVVDPAAQLLWIDFRSRPATDDAFVTEHLEALVSHVVELSLAGTAIGDDALGLVSGMTHLERLDLSRTACTPAGLAVLAEADALRSLNLTSVLLGDDAVPALASLEGLEQVSLWGSGLSAEGLDRLRLARPTLEVNAGERPVLNPEEVEQPVSFSKFPELDAVNGTCPVTGSPVDSRYKVVHEGRVVGFCCPNCPTAFLKDPAKYPVGD